MKALIVTLACSCLALVAAHPTYSESRITLYPEIIIQGEPLIITIENSKSASSLKEIIFDKQTIKTFVYKSKLTAFIGIDLNAKIGEHSITIHNTDGTVTENKFVVHKRDKVEAPLGIPETLGGNSTSSQKKLTVSLSKENDILSNLTSSQKKLWDGSFIYPVAVPIVVDPYGYSRKTGEYSIAHKGKDFRAREGTKVFAMNRGIVRVAKKSPIYGNMVVIDHGLGLMTMYMHLSKINVKQGTLVAKGKVIGLSGKTGYALGPHLHLSIRLNSVSIDPIKFLDFFTASNL